MLIIGRYSGVTNLLIHEHFTCFDRLTAILTFLPLFHYPKRLVFGLFIKPPDTVGELIARSERTIVQDYLLFVAEVLPCLFILVSLSQFRSRRLRLHTPPFPRALPI